MEVAEVTVETQVENEWLRKLIMEEGIVRVPQASKELTEINFQGHYRWQFYLRRVLLNRQVIEAVGAEFWRQHEDVPPFQLGGIESAGVPVLMSILATAPRPVNAFIIRKEPKKYGLQNWLEGVPNDLPVVLIDDVTSPVHSAFWSALKVLHNVRLRPAGSMFVVVNKQYAKFNLIATSKGSVEIKFMFDLDDLEIPIR